MDSIISYSCIYRTREKKRISKSILFLECSQPLIQTGSFSQTLSMEFEELLAIMSIWSKWYCYDNHWLLHMLITLLWFLNIHCLFKKFSSKSKGMKRIWIDPFALQNVFNMTLNIQYCKICIPPYCEMGNCKIRSYNFVNYTSYL